MNVNIGKFTQPTSSFNQVKCCFELINPLDIHLALTIFEKDLDKLFIGQKLVACTNREELTSKKIALEGPYNLLMTMKNKPEE